MRFIRVMKGNLPEDQEKRREQLMREIFGDDEFEQMEEERIAKLPPPQEEAEEAEIENPEQNDQAVATTNNTPTVIELEAEEEEQEPSTDLGLVEEIPFDEVGEETIESKSGDGRAIVPSTDSEGEYAPESEPEAESAAPEVPAAQPKTHEEILAKNTNYVFIFGYTGSGKSTVLTAINMYMRQHYRVILNQTENQEGIRLIHEMMRDIESGRFPQPTSIGKITEYDTAFTMEGEDVNLTFLEMAGEDLKKVDVDEGEEGLSDELLAYLTCPDISISFLLVADFERVVQRKEDKLILQFLSYLYNEGIDMSRVGVVLSKFDADKTDMDVEQVIKKYLPQVDKWLTSDDIAHPKVFPFSIGQINSYPDRKDDIAEIELDDCGEVVPWLHEVLSLPGAQAQQTPQKKGVAQKLKGFLGL